MFYFRLIGIALRSLDSHFLRSLLATVGVLIGVASVVASMSILEGAASRINEYFQAFGSDVLHVFPAEAKIQGRTVGVAQTLDVQDGQELRKELSDEIAQVAPVAMGRTDIRHLQRVEEYNLIATSTAYFEINDYKAETGAIFSRSDSADPMANVIMLGSKVVEDLFGGMDPLGQTVKVRNIPYRVIGVMEKRGNVGFMNADETVYIPIQTGLKRFFNREFLDSLIIRALEGVKLEELQKRVSSTLRQLHNIRAGQEDDFTIFNQQQALSRIQQSTTIFRVVLYSIAGISLVVGGIGIMNIMLVSVTERTREIGVRMACGARRMDIMLQFLVESLIISLLGGGFGLLLGWMLSDLIDKVLQGTIITEISLPVVQVALMTAVIVGVISGIYPAYKASRKDPVEALRYE